MTHLRKKLPPHALETIKSAMAVTEDAAEQVYADHFDIPTTLAAWQISSTTASAETVFENGAAILPKSIIGDADLPRVEGFRKIILAIGTTIRKPDKTTHEGYYVADLLRDIDFQHHQSTNGLWNPELQRWERWGARDQDGWLKPAINDPNEKSYSQPRVSPRTFQRIKKQLIEMGLIEQKRKVFPRERPIWLKPTTELSRILFEPGYWEQVREKYAPAKTKEKPAPETVRKRRGLSARNKQIDDANLILYRQVIHYELTGLTAEITSLIWDKLTKPIPLTKNYIKRPFAEKGSHRYKRIVAVLGMHWD